MWLTALLFGLCGLAHLASAQKVFAFVQVNYNQDYTKDLWIKDMKKAASFGIDGFHLNAAMMDDKNADVQKQLGLAYDAADAMHNFQLYITFDYLFKQNWTYAAAADTVHRFKDRPSHLKWKDTGKPVFSTFEGMQFVSDWEKIKKDNDIFFSPGWHLAGPANVTKEKVLDGQWNWMAWPVGANDMTDASDKDWLAALNGRGYIMSTGAWFYKNIPSLPNSNWLWRSDDLWHERWQEIAQLKPDLVCIISWNEYTEGHYLSTPQVPSQVWTEAQWYQEPHDHFLNDLPHYIAAYKGKTAPRESHLTFYYKQNPGRACSNNGTTCDTGIENEPIIDPALCAQDKIFFTNFMHRSSTVTITIGHSKPQTLRSKGAGVFHGNVDLAGRTGKVKISARGDDGHVLGPYEGPEITNKCDRVNWNAWAGGS